MDVQSVITCYVDDVTAQLPRKMRSDVAKELHVLLEEELQDKAEAAGRAADPAMATELLRAFGKPSDVAARYHPMYAIVDPSDTRTFLIAAISGAAVIQLLGIPAITLRSQYEPGLLALAWLGALVIYYGVKSWNARQYPSRTIWTPRDRDRVNRFGSAGLVVIILCGIVAYGAPVSAFATVTGGIKLPSSLLYAPGFEFRLYWLLAVWGLTAILYVVLLIQGRWSLPTRWTSIALNTAVIGLLIWFRFSGAMFQTSYVDDYAKSFLSLIVIIMIIETAVQFYGAARRSFG